MPSDVYQAALGTLDKVAIPTRLHGWPVVSHDDDAGRKRVATLKDLLQRGFGDADQIHGRFGVQD